MRYETGDVVQDTDRETWTLSMISGDYADHQHREKDPSGNLVSSLLRGNGNMHAPVIDLDYPHRLVPSSTEGHSHLYLNQAMTWRQYKRILKALTKAGVIQPGWYRSAKSHKMSFVRREGVTK